MSEAGLRDVMRCFPQGVSVVTAAPAGREPRGITVSSFISVSLEPPLILVSIAVTAQAHEAIDGAGAYTVNVLAEDQAAVSDRFARSGLTSAEQFEDIAVRAGATGAPVLVEALAHLDAKVVDRLRQADHTLFVGEVVRSAVLRDARPLVFYARQYWGLGAPVGRRD